MRPNGWNRVLIAKPVTVRLKNTIAFLLKRKRMGPPPIPYILKRLPNPADTQQILSMPAVPIVTQK